MSAAVMGLIGVGVLAAALAGRAAMPTSPFACLEADEVAPEPPDSIHARAVSAGLNDIAHHRGLSALRPVRVRRLSRERIRACFARLISSGRPGDDHVRAIVEATVALELIPVNYDLVGAVEAWYGEALGYYVPGTDTIVVRDDLRGVAPRETLVHELTHAVRDQARRAGGESIAPPGPGDGDRALVLRLLEEGEAVAVAAEVMSGSAFTLSTRELREHSSIVKGISPVVGAMPAWLRASGLAPYTDGFDLIQRLRSRGGWAAVDATWRTPPATTEQALHDDKLAAREPAIPVPPPSLEALGTGWRVAGWDTDGELGIRLAATAWTDARSADAAAAGWGGDTWVVARLGPDDTVDGRYAFAWHVVLDTDKDARELSTVFARFFGEGCNLRPALGPSLWLRRGVNVVLVSGPYERRGSQLQGRATCADARRWAESILNVAASDPRKTKER